MLIKSLRSRAFLSRRDRCVLLFARNLLFISWQNLNLKIIIELGIVVQKPRSVISTGSFILAFVKFKGVMVHYLPLQSCVALFCRSNTGANTCLSFLLTGLSVQPLDSNLYEL